MGSRNWPICCSPWSCRRGCPESALRRSQSPPTPDSPTPTCRVVSRIEESINGVVNRVVSQSAQMGALPQLYAATSPAVRGGEYIGPDGFLEMRGYPTVVQPNGRGKDTVDAARLWAESVRLTGVDYAELDSVSK